MRYFIRIGLDNKIVMKANASEPLYDTVEISKEEYSKMDFNNYQYFYIDDKVIQGDEIEQSLTLDLEPIPLDTNLLHNINNKLNRIIEHLGI